MSANHLTPRNAVLCAAATSALVQAALSTSAFAATREWDGGSSVNSSIGTPENWVGDIAPGSSDIAAFPAISVAPPRAPFITNAESVGGITIDNSGGYVWQLPRDSAGTRSLTIGSDGLTITGGGSTQFGAIPTFINVNQIWNLGGSTTLTFLTGSGGNLSGSGKITKSGAGTISLSNSNTGFTGGWEVTNGLLLNQGNSTNGPGTGTIRVSGTGVYQVISGSGTVSGGQILLGNGGKFIGSTGVGTGNQGLATENAAVSTIEVATGNTYSTASTVTGGDSASLINVTGGGTLTLTGGVANASQFKGTWKIGSNTFLRPGEARSLGDSSTTGTSTRNDGASSIELAGGALLAAGTGSGSTAVALNHPLKVTANSQLLLDKTGTAGTAATNAAGTTIARSFGSLNLGAATLTVGNSSQITGPQTAGQTVKLGLGSTTLSGNGTISVTNPAFSFEVFTLSISETGGSRSLTKSGTGFLNIVNASTYTGGTVVSQGKIQASNQAAFGTGPISVAAGAEAVFVNGSGTWNLKNDLSGSGTITGGAGTLNLQGSAISPGTSPGVLTIDTNVALALDGLALSALNIEVDSGNGGLVPVAGTHYDQLAISSLRTLTGLNNAVLNIEFDPSVTQSDITGDVLVIVSSPGTNFSLLSPAQHFNSVTFSSGATGTVNYLDGSITLTNIQIPEPTSLSLLALGGLALRRRR